MDESSKNSYDKSCNLFKNLAQSRVEWPNRIHVAKPNITGAEL